METILGNPLYLSLCGGCPAYRTGNSAGIRSAIRERWAMQAAAQRAKRRAELERKAQEDVERVAKMDGGIGGVFEVLHAWGIALNGHDRSAS